MTMNTNLSDCCKAEIKRRAIGYGGLPIYCNKCKQDCEQIITKCECDAFANIVCHLCQLKKCEQNLKEQKGLLKIAHKTGSPCAVIKYMVKVKYSEGRFLPAVLAAKDAEADERVREERERVIKDFEEIINNMVLKDIDNPNNAALNELKLLFKKS